MRGFEQARILVIDDSQTVLLQFRRLLEGESFAVETASRGAEGIEKVQSFLPHVIILDYFLPEMTAVEVVAEIRSFDTRAQIVLATGHADEKPAREMMKRLDIQGFHDKLDGTGKLMVWVDAALKAYRSRATIEDHANALRQIVESSAVIHRIQPLVDLYAGALDEMVHLLSVATGDSDSWHGVLTAGEEGADWRVVSTVGPFSGITWKGLPEPLRELMEAAVSTRSIQRSEAPRYLAVPLVRESVGVGAFGMVIPETGELELPRDYLELLAKQVVVARDNIRLYEMATTDSLTGLASRAHVLSRLLDWLKLSGREQTPLGLVFIDIDQLKPVNDLYGHTTGDVFIRTVGDAIRASVRDTDIAGRFGGDELLVVLPVSDGEVTRLVAERIESAIRAQTVELGDGNPLSPSASVGCLSIDGRLLEAYMRRGRRDCRWEELCRNVIEIVDSATYTAKARGGGQVASVANTEVVSRLAQLFGLHTK